ncbi:aspartyl-tRNA synthetase [Auricularia subglabra TFB-10046 SS5]|nr:aspartyl-tRNA synthetase [Auricularia subglabra TFB-10046 SS5]
MLTGDDGEPLSKNQQRKREKEEQKREKIAARDAEAEELERQRLEDDEKAAREETPEQRARYGPVGRAADFANDRTLLSSLTADDAEREITFRARLHTIRVKSAGLAFYLFRQRGVSIQGVLESSKDPNITEHMIRWTRRLLVESVVLVTGKLQRPPTAVVGASLHDIELRVHSIHLISAATTPVPFDVYHAELTPRDAMDDADTDIEGELSDAELERRVDKTEHEQYQRALKLPQITDRTRFAHRVMDLRTGTAQAIFRVQSGICSLFRLYLEPQGFIEIHTPKLQGGATESGASVFSVQYFGRPAFLAQSPQLAKQMCISADFERVYEIGPVFRAENSNTHRHLTEYTGLDIEMAFEKDYHEVMHLIDGLIKNMLKGVHERFANELSSIRHQFPSEPLVWLDETPVLTFREGVKMLQDSGWTDDSELGLLTRFITEDDDLSTRGEIRLGELVKEKYKTDYYILDKFPASARPFYTMPDKDDPKFTNSFDIFLRGQEILTGGQRVHDARQLEAAMRQKGVRPETMEEYMDGFRWGAPPHAGCGFGLERIVMLLLGLGDVRHASLFPRDPKSLPAPPDLGEVLRHPEANTLEPSWARHRAEGTEDDFPPLEKLIANYGDAPNTAWLDRRYEIWRHAATGAAVGFSRQGKYVIIIGDPLCDRSQLPRVAGAFLRWVQKELKLKPLWLLTSEAMERVLGEKHGWRTMTCVAEARVEPASAAQDPKGDVGRKVRHAEKEGVAITDIPLSQEVPADVRAECDERIKDWMEARKGKQVHLTDVDPWTDYEHRKYFIGRDKVGKVCGMVVLAQLAVRNGYQIKWALDFPGAPGGTIEYMVLHAIREAQGMGAKTVTFGATPSAAFEAAHNIPGIKAKALAHTYTTITKTLRLLNKSEFKEKLGAVQDAEYICYPPRGLGPMAVRAILKFFGASEEVAEENTRDVRQSEDTERTSTGPASFLRRSLDTVRRKSRSTSRSRQRSLRSVETNGSGLATPPSQE